MQIHAFWSKNGAGAGKEYGAWGFEEEEGLFRFGVVEFLDVVATYSRDFTPPSDKRTPILGRR